MSLLEIGQYPLLGNPLSVWALGVLAAVAAWIVLTLIRRVTRGRLAALARRREARALAVAEHVVRETKTWFLVLVALFIGAQFVVFELSADSLITKILLIGLLFQAGLWVSAAVLEFVRVKRAQGLEENRSAVAAIDVLSFVANVAIWTVVLLLVLDNVGVNITALVAGLGVGGIAVALAAQNILSDLFASLSIVLDKPFIVGDFLIVGEHLGSVERVGIKTTRIRSLSGEQLIFSNNDLLGSRIRNYGRMSERRVVFSLGVTYQTPVEKLKRIPGMIRNAVESQQEIRFDRAHFQSYGDFALIFEVVYYVLLADYNAYMDIQQAINLRIAELFEGDGIAFAYPTQTVYVHQDAQG